MVKKSSIKEFRKTLREYFENQFEDSDRMRRAADGYGETEFEENKDEEDKGMKGPKLSLDDFFADSGEGIEGIEEVSPPGNDAESFIKQNKDEFKKRYGDRWEEILYATAWEKFGKK